MAETRLVSVDGTGEGDTGQSAKSFGNNYEGVDTLDVEDSNLGKRRGHIGLEEVCNRVHSYTDNSSFTSDTSLASCGVRQIPAGSRLCSWLNENLSPADMKSFSDGSVGISQTENPSNMKLQRKASRPSRRDFASLRRTNVLRALALERELTDNHEPINAALIIQFPDTEITYSKVTAFSKSIKDVVFPNNMGPRQCLVHLKSETNVDEAISEINQIRFGNGYLKAELKVFSDEELAANIDPCSLYISNVPFNMTATAIKGHFANSQRVDIGVNKREKRARYAFVRYANAELAMEAYRELVKTPLNNRILTVRYRRLRRHTLISTGPNTKSSLSLDTTGTDDDSTDCRVISPPPVDTITVSDSDSECSDNSSVATLKFSKKRKIRVEENDEIRKLKLRMAEFEEILKTLQPTKSKSMDVIFAHKGSSSGLSFSEAISSGRSLSPNSYRAKIKSEQDFFGVTEFASEAPSPYMPTTVVLDNGTSNSSGNGNIKNSNDSPLSKEKIPPNEDGSLKELYARLDSDID